jgi:hypothetical protein
MAVSSEEIKVKIEDKRVTFESGLQFALIEIFSRRDRGAVLTLWGWRIRGEVD